MYIVSHMVGEGGQVGGGGRGLAEEGHCMVGEPLPSGVLIRTQLEKRTQSKLKVYCMTSCEHRK